MFIFVQTLRQTLEMIPIKIWFIWKAAGGSAACPDIHCLVRVLVSPNLYNGAGECKVTHRTTTATFMGNGSLKKSPNFPLNGVIFDLFTDTWQPLCPSDTTLPCLHSDERQIGLLSPLTSLTISSLNNTAVCVCTDQIRQIKTCYFSFSSLTKRQRRNSFTNSFNI